MGSPPDATPPVQRIDYSQTLTARQKKLTLVGVLLGLFLAALDQTVVATATPRILQDLKGIDLLAWVSTSYLLASTAMVPIYGKLSDIYGRKVILLFGIFVFLAASVLCGTAGSMEMLVAYRGLQGMGAAALTSTAFSVPADLFVPAERPRYQGLFGAVFGLSSVIGPYLGGLLTDGPGWRWVFYVNLPLGAVATVFIITQMPRLNSGLKSRVDYLGAAMLLLAVVPLLLGLTLDKTVHGWTSPLILGLFAASVVGLVLLILVERVAPSPIIPLGLFKNAIYTLICTISLLQGAFFFAVILYLSIFMVNVLGVSATESGTALMPMTLAIVVGSMMSSVIVQKLGHYKVPIMLGLVLVGLGIGMLSVMDVGTTVNDVRLRMVIIGLGLGPCMPLLNLALQIAVPFDKVGVATASRQFFQQLGSSAGSAIFGALLTSTLTTSMEANMAPIRAQLPPALAAQVNVASLKHGGHGQEGSGPDGTDSIAHRMEAGIHAGFEEQREVFRKGLLDGDSAALKKLEKETRLPREFQAMLVPGALEAVVDRQVEARLKALDESARAQDLRGYKSIADDPLTPPAVHKALTEADFASLTDDKTRRALLDGLQPAIVASKPELLKASRLRMYERAMTGLAEVEKVAVQNAVTTGEALDGAVRKSFAHSITTIYRMAVPLVVLAFLLMFFVKELPLRRTNDVPPPAAAEV